ncbi:MAG TPA: glycosyltransferase family 2 protein [Bacteroidota bacterium]|nr:glycosyltransferase family 2 protein [Bacteroidota bacterium]
MKEVLSVLLWVSFLLILYTYALYPFLLLLITRPQNSQKDVQSKKNVPSVTILISAHNEEQVISQRISNLKELDYPKEKLQVLIGSDGSTDGTNALMTKAKTSHIKLVTFQQRRGKAAVLNDLMTQARGEIVIFSDANTIFDPGVVKRLVRHFSDPQVGAVSGELRLETDRRSVGGVGESFYWQYETLVKRLESRFASLVGATGGVYAIRKSLFEPLPIGKSVNDDFVIPLHILKKGYRVVYEPEAVAFEHVAGSVRGEFKRKVRIGAQNFASVWLVKDMLHPKKGFPAFALWSHKILRWCVPFFLIILFSSSLALSLYDDSYRSLFWAHVVFWGLVVIGFTAEQIDWNIGVGGFPYYFVAMNAALFVGFIKFLAGVHTAAWEVTR